MPYLSLIIGIIALLIGIPIGNLLAKLTQDELKSGKRWFKRLVLLGFLGTIIGLIIGNDPVLFTFAFIAIVTSRSLK